MDQPTIGDRVRFFRGKMTQKELADRAGLHKDVISFLEQNRKGRQPKLTTLHQIAKALDVDLADLVGKRYGIPTEDPDGGVVAIRRALTSVDDLLGENEAEPVSLTEAQRSVHYAWGAYWGGRYELLATILPPGITQLRATAHAAQNSEIAPAHELLARMYWVTGCTLVHMGQNDPAFMAIRYALEAAQKGSDELLSATLRGSVAWQLLVQGRIEESHKVALRTAASIEPRGDVSEDHLAVYGSLMLQGATASGRDQRTADALSLADEADQIAKRIGTDTKHYECNFGPSQVVMQTIDINVSSERYPEALTVAKSMPNRGLGLSQVSQARSLTDRAVALARLGKHQEASNALLAAERVGGGEWAKYQTLLKQTLEELLAQDPQKPLRGFAKRVGVAV